jgi:phage shock protein PspC (stress-responsive transcriptional regulator)
MSYNSGRLTRSQSGKMVGGVLSGLARRYGLDLTWLRIGVLFASCITFGIVVLSYIVAMIIIPKE